jgi:hypothetical protein
LTVVVGITSEVSSKTKKGFEVMRATVKISKISRDGRLKIKFIALVNSDKLVSAFHSGSISIKVSSL